MPSVDLLSPGRIDGFDTRNRMFMAPMTRSRALPGGVPSDLAIEYYGQRASAGLLITEGTRAGCDWNRLCADAVDRHA